MGLAEMSSRYEEAYFTSEGLRTENVPNEMPPDGYVSPDILREIEIAGLPSPKRRIAAWTMALGVLVSSFRFATFGLADPLVEQKALAVFMYVDTESGPGIEKSRPIRELRIGQQSFIVWVRPIKEIKHINLRPADPVRNKAMGVIGCMARSLSGGSMMLVTAKHVVSKLLPNEIVGGEWVPLQDTSKNYFVGRVYAKPPGALDVVLIEPIPVISLTDHPNFTPFSAPPVVTLGDAVELQLPSGKVPARIVETNGAANVPLSNTPPEFRAIQIIMDQYGEFGDSGSLVIEKTTATGVAIYTGALDATDYGGVIRGVGQYLGQVAVAMNIELLKE
jgi:hypothetical protein